MRLIAVMMVVLLADTDSGAARSEQIDIPLGEEVLHAALYRPAGGGPFPAIVALHGCGGLGAKREAVAARYRDWGERLAAAGFVVLFPDSFGSRGLGSQCTVRDRAVRTSRERVTDANAARRWLQGRNFVAPDRVSLLGWSNGATAALWAVRPRAAVKDNTPDFRSAVALYPGCRRLGEGAWSARVPTLILIGAADDWTPAGPCEQMVAGARGRSARVAIIVYPGAHHGFDHPDQPLRQHTGLAFSADGSGKAHSGTNPAARSDALKRVPEWLGR